MATDDDNALESARSALNAAGGPFAVHSADALTGIDDFAEWLASASAAVKAGDFVIPAMGDSAPDTLFLDLNEFAYNPDEWFLSALAYAWESRDPDDIEVSEFFDATVGHEVGDVRSGHFTLTGLESMQECFAEHLETADESEVALAEEFVITTVFDGVDRALSLAGDLGLRIALSRSEEPRIALWQFGESGWSREVLVEDEDF